MRRLEEVDVIRALSMLLIVLTHSFALYTGAWEHPGGESEIKLYSIIARMLVNLSLPTFVLISGYLFSFTYKRKVQSFKNVLVDRFQRIIIPSIVFGIPYILIFFKDLPFINKTLLLLNGAGHLWFLPMLFWNYLIGYFLKKNEFNNITSKLIFLFFLFIIAIIGPTIIPNVLGVSRALGYIPYFFIGLELYNYREVIIERLKPKVLILIVVLYLLLFTLNEIILNRINFLTPSTVSKLYNVAYKHFLSIGIIAFYILVIFRMKIMKTALNQKVIKMLQFLSAYSFGIYIYHQFVMKYFIYNLHVYNLISYKVGPLFFL